MNNNSQSSNPYQTLDIDRLLQQRGDEVENFYRLTELVNAGLSKEIIAVVIDLIEKGVNPESIATGKDQNSFLLHLSAHFISSSHFGDKEQAVT
jgi:hypothetical protein